MEEIILASVLVGLIAIYVLDYAQNTKEQPSGEPGDVDFNRRQKFKVTTEQPLTGLNPEFSASESAEICVNPRH